MLEKQEIKGTTRLIGLLGYPVVHSLSPQIHNHAFRKLDIPFAYVPLEVKPERIREAVEAFRVLGFAGANVTIPHKQSVAGLCNKVSNLSRLSGTVNTLYFENDNLCATTTDAQGFFGALEKTGHDPSGCDIVILGNGGTARTLGFALAQGKKPRTLALAGRNKQRVSSLADEIRSRTGFEVDWAMFGSDKLGDIIAGSSLLVNCTSVGMYPNSDVSPLGPEHFRSKTTVLDTVYNPSETKFLSYAKRAGCPAQNGLRMLLYQALESFKYWTGVEAPESLFDLNELQSLIVN